MEDNAYILKHKDKDVAIFNVEKGSKNVKYIEILDNVFSPVNSKESGISQIVSFNSWLNDRCISDSRDGVERIKVKYGLNNMKELMYMMHGLSLSDCYWIEKISSNNKWKDINLYDNEYSDLIGRMLFDKKIKLVNNIGDYGLRTPEVATGGSLRKYWHYNESNKLSYLIKGSSKPYFQEPFNEYFASLLINELKYNNADYVLDKRGNEYVSVCPCFCSKDKELINGVDIVRKYGIEKNYNGFITLSEKKGCAYIKDELNKMIALDYIIDNIDRHWYNFGILRNTDTGKWIGLAPLYDNGYSLWNNDFVDSRIVSESMSFADSNEACIKMIDINKYIKKLPNLIEIFDVAFEKYDNKEMKGYEERKNRKCSLRNGLIERNVIIEKYLQENMKINNNVKNRNNKSNNNK